MGGFFSSSSQMHKQNVDKEKSARWEFNLCQMCWMPLYTNPALQEDRLWGLIQLVFKEKPAFSVEADGSKKERPVLVFGVSELHAKENGDLPMNCEDCHYIHTSVCHNTVRFDNIWGREMPCGVKVDINIYLALTRILTGMRCQGSRSQCRFH
jgi:hypothetical protein